MSLSDFIDSVTDDAFLNTDFFGESIVRWPGGVEANSETVTCVFNQQEPDRKVVDGLYRQQMATITIAASQSVSAKDLWIYQNRTWSTETVEEADHGMRDVHLMSTDFDHRTSGGGRRL